MIITITVTIISRVKVSSVLNVSSHQWKNHLCLTSSISYNYKKMSKFNLPFPIHREMVRMQGNGGGGGGMV